VTDRWSLRPAIQIVSSTGRYLGHNSLSNSLRSMILFCFLNSRFYADIIRYNVIVWYFFNYIFVLPNFNAWNLLPIVWEFTANLHLEWWIWCQILGFDNTLQNLANSAISKTISCEYTNDSKTGLIPHIKIIAKYL
jgi:hypothetical protein